MSAEKETKILDFTVRKLNDDGGYEDKIYKAGKLVHIKLWWKNDKLREVCDYKDDMKHGLEMRWYFNGQLHQEIHWEFGKIGGRYREYLVNGALSEDSEWNMGKRKGLEYLNI